MAYSDKVIDHYENPRNVGSFDKGDDSVGTGMVGAPACGDAALVEAQLAGEIVEQLVAALLGFQREHEGRIGVDIDGLDRVHLNCNLQAHLIPPGRFAALSWA